MCIVAEKTKSGNIKEFMTLFRTFNEHPSNLLVSVFVCLVTLSFVFCLFLRHLGHRFVTFKTTIFG